MASNAEGRARMKPGIAVEPLVLSGSRDADGGSSSETGAATPVAPLEFVEEVDGDCHTLSLVGELDVATTPELEAAIVRLCDAGAKEIVLDLHELTSIDASGLRLIMSASRVCERHGCDFALTRVHSPAHKLFDVRGTIGRLSFRGRSFAQRIARRVLSRAGAPLNLSRPDFDVVLDLNRDAPRSARNYVRDLLRVDASHELRDAVMLLTSEIVTPLAERVTTALLECGELLVWLRGDLVRVEFRAPSRLLSSAPEDDGPRYDTEVLDGFADRWSIDASGASARIWFEIERPWKARESQSTGGGRADANA